EFVAKPRREVTSEVARTREFEFVERTREIAREIESVYLRERIIDHLLNRLEARVDLECDVAKRRIQVRFEIVILKPDMRRKFCTRGGDRELGITSIVDHKISQRKRVGAKFKDLVWCVSSVIDPRLQRQAGDSVRGKVGRHSHRERLPVN